MIGSNICLWFCLLTTQPLTLLRDSPPSNSCLDAQFCVQTFRKYQLLIQCPTKRNYAADLQSFMTQWTPITPKRRNTRSLSTTGKHSLGSFSVGDIVWLSCPRAGKLDARWEGGWRISKVIGSSNYEIENSKVMKVVHVYRLRLRVQPDFSISQERECNEPLWQPPSVQHESLFEDSPPRQSLSAQPENPPLSRHYPQRERRPPERLIMTQK